MRFKTILILTLILFLPYVCLSKNTIRDINREIRLKERKLSYIKKRKKKLELLRHKLLKLYITLYIKKAYETNIVKFLKNADYLSLLKEEEKFKLMERALVRKIVKIKNEEKRLDVTCRKIQEEIKKLSEKREKLKARKAVAIHPITGRPVDVGDYIFRVEKPSSVFAPISGMVKGITYKHTEIDVLIENKNCTASIAGLDEIKVNIGDNVLKRQIIGRINKTKDLYFTLKCKNSGSENYNLFSTFGSR